MDLTKITMPFGLLDKETQDALKAWPHGVLSYRGVLNGEWIKVDARDERWIPCMVYRVIPATPREWWIPMFGEFPGPPFITEAEARDYHPDAQRIIYVREVMDDDLHRHNDAAMLQSAAAMIPAEEEE